jgi:hypothetical protein
MNRVYEVFSKESTYLSKRIQNEIENTNCSKSRVNKREIENTTLCRIDSIFVDLILNARICNEIQ